MMVSKHTIDMEVDGTNVLINPLYGSVMDLDQENYNRYKEILSDSRSYPEETSILQQQGFLFESDDQEKVVTDMIYQSIMTGGEECHLIIMTTSACNMQCVYCFEHLHPVFPEERCADDIVSFIRRRHEIAAFKKLHVTWFGGEPLLNIDYIRHLSMKMIAYADANDIAYESDMITNGILFSKDIAMEAIRNWRLFSAQITLDGTKNIHNQRRPYGNKDGFSIIMNNILRTCEEVEIILRINIDSINLKDAEELLRYLSEYDTIRNNVQIAFGRVINNEPTCISINDFGRVENRLRNLLESYHFTHTIEAYSLRGNPIGCGALTDSVFVISPTGDLYKCMETVGDSSYCIGNVRCSDGMERNIIAERYRIREKCTECNKQLLCNTRICPLHYRMEDDKCYYTDDMIVDLIRRIRRVEDDEFNHQQVVA